MRKVEVPKCFLPNLPKAILLLYFEKKIKIEVTDNFMLFH